MRKNVETYRAAHDAFSRRDREALRALVSPSFTYTDNPRALTMKTAEEFVAWTDEWVTAFSDATPAEPHYIDGGDTVVALFTGTGTNDGPMGPYPATGRRMAVPFCEIMRFDQNGTPVSGEVYYDAMSILVQLGLIEPPPQP